MSFVEEEESEPRSEYQAELYPSKFVDYSDLKIALFRWYYTSPEF